MPSVFVYLLIMLLAVIIWFMVMKRPVYEALLISLLILLTITGTWPNVMDYLADAFGTSLLYCMTAFIAMSLILTKTKVIDGSIAIILALVGRIPGGAGYAALISSVFMGALSGSGPGNVMATGTITIPAMKKTGFPAHLAANIEVQSSCLGNTIPPSSNIVAALGAYLALFPNSDLTNGQFWMVLWGCSLWFVLLKMITIFGFCKFYHIQPLAKEDIPKLGTVLRENWKGLFLPVIILFPFVLDYLYKATFFTERLGAAGAKYFSSSMLLFIGGLGAAYACLIAKGENRLSLHDLVDLFANSIKKISPTVFVCLIGYTIGGIFNDLNVAAEMEAFILAFHFDKFSMILFLNIITCLLGMVIIGSSLVVIFGSVFITTLVSVGVDPLLAAAMLPCICGVMGNITPPLAPCFYAGLSVSGADFGKMVKNSIWWIVGQFALQVIVLMGWLPIFGL